MQPLVSLALANVAHATIRNRGTTVGSIVHADAAAEMPMVLRLLGGSVEVVASRVAGRSRPTTSSSARWSRRSTTTRSRSRRSSRRWPTGPASPSRRSPVVTATSRRTIAADDLYVGPLESSLHHDEIAVSAFFPPWRRAGVAFEEIARRHGDYALCGVAALVQRNRAAGYLSVCEVPTSST